MCQNVVLFKRRREIEIACSKIMLVGTYIAFYWRTNKGFSAAALDENYIMRFTIEY